MTPLVDRGRSRYYYVTLRALPLGQTETVSSSSLYVVFYSCQFYVSCKHEKCKAGNNSIVVMLISTENKYEESFVTNTNTLALAKSKNKKSRVGPNYSQVSVPLTISLLHKVIKCLSPNLCHYLLIPEQQFTLKNL